MLIEIFFIKHIILIIEINVLKPPSYKANGVNSSSHVYKYCCIVLIARDGCDVFDISSRDNYWHILSTIQISLAVELVTEINVTQFSIGANVINVIAGRKNPTILWIYQRCFTFT